MICGPLLGIAIVVYQNRPIATLSVLTLTR